MPLFDLWLMTTSSWGRNRSTTTNYFPASNQVKEATQYQLVTQPPALIEESLQEGATDKDSSQKEEEKI